MAIFGIGKKKTEDQIQRFFKDRGISLEIKDNKYSFELVLRNKGYSLYPYFTVNDDKKEISFCINIRKADGGLTLLDYERINAFNLKSKYLQVKKSETNVLFLEYNAKVSKEDLPLMFDEITENVFMLEAEIDEL